MIAKDQQDQTIKDPIGWRIQKSHKNIKLLALKKDQREIIDRIISQTIKKNREN